MMQSLAVNGYTETEVVAALHSANSVRHVSFEFRLLDRLNAKIGTLEATGGSVSLSSDAAIKRSGRFTIKDSKDIDWLNDRIQPVFRLEMPDGRYAEWGLGIFLVSSPSRQGVGQSIYRDVVGYDVSVILEEDKFTDRHVVPSGTNYISAINAMLIGAGITFAEIAPLNSTLPNDREFEGGTSRLTAVNTLLSEINYTSIWADEDGLLRASPFIMPFDQEIEYVYRSDRKSIITADAVNELDLFSVPNSWVVVASNPDLPPMRSTYINDRITSKTSTVNRKRTISRYAQVNNIADQAALDNYARRMAYDDSVVYDVMRFETAIMPHHSFASNLYLDYAPLNISSKYQEYMWSMPLQPGGRMTHEARRVIFL